MIYHLFRRRHTRSFNVLFSIKMKIQNVLQVLNVFVGQMLYFMQEYWRYPTVHSGDAQVMLASVSSL